MNTNRAITWTLLSLSTLNLPLPTAFAQGTAFTYQGRLDGGGAPHTGSAEFQPTLWNAASGGGQIGSGVVESGHRHVLQARLKKAGTAWRPEHADQIAHLRVLRANNQSLSIWN